MKLRWKILIVGGLFLLLVGASMMMTMHVQPASEVEACKNALRAAGEKLEISEIMPAPVAPEDNSVNAVQDAFRLLGSANVSVPNAMAMVAPGRAMVGWQQPDARNTDFTNSWDEFAAAIEADRPAIELLHQVLTRPKLDFQLDYKQGAKLTIPHLAQMKRSAQMLTAATVYELHGGNTGAATTNILTLLALVQKDATEGLLISHLVRIAITAIAVNPTWEVLQATNADDAQLAALESGWQQLHFLSDAENMFVTERVWILTEIEKSRASHDGFKDTMGMIGSGLPGSSGGSAWGWPDMLENATAGLRMGVSEGMWRSSWSYSEELTSLKSHQIILEALRAMQTNRSEFYKADYDAMSGRLSSLGLTNPGAAFFRALKIPDFRGEFGGGVNRAPLRMIQIETARRIVMAAIALKRFQLKHGNWPGTLNELAPEFLASVPIDPYDGKPLKYHLATDGTFLLYSVGENGRDDGGDATGSTHFYWQRALDWVWPQPASPADVQNFYEHPPK